MHYESAPQSGNNWCLYKIMNYISKPALVSLLRIFDQRKFFVPRLRYASVRSKPELMNDLSQYFGTAYNGVTVKFLRKGNVPTGVPLIHYHLKEKQYYFDGIKAVHHPIRERLRFSVKHEPVLVRFQTF